MGKHSDCGCLGCDQRGTFISMIFLPNTQNPSLVPGQTPGTPQLRNICKRPNKFSELSRSSKSCKCHRPKGSKETVIKHGVLGGSDSRRRASIYLIADNPTRREHSDTPLLLKEPPESSLWIRGKSELQMQPGLAGHLTFGPVA